MAKSSPGQYPTPYPLRGNPAAIRKEIAGPHDDDGMLLILRLIMHVLPAVKLAEGNNRRTTLLRAGPHVNAQANAVIGMLLKETLEIFLINVEHAIRRTTQQGVLLGTLADVDGTA